MVPAQWGYSPQSPSTQSFNSESSPVSPATFQPELLCWDTYSEESQELL